MSVTLYDVIRARCKDRGITVQELERRADIRRNTINRWGVNIPSVDKVMRVADVLGVTVDELLKE
ncbi:MAG: helix-turn-helix transcriptional regulator [Clostridia bacterium]|nr:helix-turn-helix transcriptional regulator [Clostridia bacterium]